MVHVPVNELPSYVLVDNLIKGLKTNLTMSWRDIAANIKTKYLTRLVKDIPNTPQTPQHQETK